MDFVSAIAYASKLSPMQSVDQLSRHAYWVIAVESKDPVVLKAVQDEMLPLWKKFLLNQFHDVLPGSCIEQVCSS